MIIALCDIYSRQNYRKTFKDIETFGDDILENGLIEPIKVESDGNGRWALIDGERRYRAMISAGISETDAIVKTGLSRIDSFLMTIGANENREDTNDIETAEGYAHALSIGATMAQLAKRTNRRIDYIERRLALLSLRDDIRKLVADGHLTIGYAGLMTELDVDRQLIAITALRDNPAPSIRWFQSVTAKLIEQQNQQTFDFGLFADGATVESLADAFQVTEPDNPADYRPTFNPFNLQDDIEQQIERWKDSGAGWKELGNDRLAEQCLTIVATLSAIVTALPVAMHNSPADRVHRLIEQSADGMTTRQVYQFANIDKSEWLRIKAKLFADNRITEMKSGRGFRYFSA